MKRIYSLPDVRLMPFSEIDEKRRVLAVTAFPAWNAVRDDLHLQIAEQVVVTEASTGHWNGFLSQIASSGCEIVYAVGGGLVADAAKYFAARCNLPLVVLPTALSVDAFITGASGIRRDGCVFYIETKSPEELILDLDIIARAPAAIRAAGIVDVLSIATGSWDWKFAQERGKNPPNMEFIPWAYENAQSILKGALDCAEGAGRGDKDGLKNLYDCLAMEVQLCNQLGHARPEEGSEHYFAYSVENLTGPGLPHGDLVGPGIMMMSKMQGQPTDTLEAALRACNIPLDRISRTLLDETLRGLPAYCQEHELPFGLAHTLNH